jgi:hypothetical protein
MKIWNVIFETATAYSLTGMEGQRDEGGRKVLLGDNIGGLAVLLLPISFQWSPFCNLYMQVTICILMCRLVRNSTRTGLPGTYRVASLRQTYFLNLPARVISSCVSITYKVVDTTWNINFNIILVTVLWQCKRVMLYTLKLPLLPSVPFRRYLTAKPLRTFTAGILIMQRTWRLF